MKRGTVILTPFPFTDLSKNKVRPALVVSSNKRKDNDIIIAFISSVIDINLSETDILLDSKEVFFKETGLKTSSVIRTDKLATIDKKIILGELGNIDIELIRKVDDHLKVVLDLL